MYIVVLITAKNVREANRIAEKLVGNQLIACANIISGVKSVFRWQGKVDKANEVLLILKSKKSLFKRIVKTVQFLHSYDVPEILALPILEGNKDYLKWIADSTVK